MKKYLLGISVLLLAGGLMAGCSSENKVNNNSENAPTTKSLKDTTKITVNEAVAIYQKHFPKTNVVSVELEKHLGKPIYIVEGADSTTEYQLNINAANKKIRQKSQEPLDEDDMNEAQTKKLDFKNVISLEKANNLASKAAKGGQGTEFKLEKDHDITTWEVNINGKEVTLDAQNGKVLKIEND